MPDRIEIPDLDDDDDFRPLSTRLFQPGTSLPPTPVQSTSTAATSAANGDPGPSTSAAEVEPSTSTTDNQHPSPVKTPTYQAHDSSADAFADERLASLSSSSTTQSTTTDDADQQEPQQSNAVQRSRPPPVISQPNTLICEPNQRENPLLKCLRLAHVINEHIEPDFVLSKNGCAFFLSVKYHNLKPNYIYDRYNKLGQAFSLRVLLVMIDVPEPRAPLKELTKFAVMTNSTLMVCWSFEEAARFLELYKQFEFRTPEVLMERQLANNRGTEGIYDCVVESLATIKKINKTDAVSLITHFDSLDKIVNSKTEQLSICPGLGPLKANELHAFFRRPFTR